jgi:hypothetical protein
LIEIGKERKLANEEAQSGGAGALTTRESYRVMQFHSEKPNIILYLAFAWNNDMSQSKRLFGVFLCHAHSDRAAVHKIHQRLIRGGIDAWLDVEKLKPGQDWQSEIRKAILKSDAVIVCLSREFNKQRGFRHKELKLAIEKAKLLMDKVFIIPVRLEKCDMPESLRHLHRVDLFVKGGYKRLVRALKNLDI